MKKINRGALFLFVLLSSVLLCTSCLSLLLSDSNDGVERVSATLKFAPDTSDPANANIPSISRSDVSVTVKTLDGEILKEEFFKAGSRTYITVRIPTNMKLKMIAEFNGPKGVWIGETQRSVDYVNYQVIIKLRKVADGVARLRDTKPVPRRKPVPTRKPTTIQKPIVQVSNARNLLPMYFSAISNMEYKFHNAKNDLKKDKFQFADKIIQKTKSVNGKTKKIFLNKTVFCRDNDSNLYILSDDETLKCYNSNGVLIKSEHNSMIGIHDLACDPITNKVYAMACWESPAGESGVHYEYGLFKVKKDLSTELITRGSVTMLWGQKYEETRPSLLSVYNGVAFCYSPTDPIRRNAYSVDLNSSNPKFKKLEFPSSYHYAGGDWPDSIINDVLVDDKHVYLITTFHNWGENPADEGRMIVYDYKILGSNGNKKVKIECDVANMKVYGGYAWGSDESGYYRKNFAVPIKFVGYRKGYVYIADDGIEKVSRNGKNKNVKDINRIVTFDIKKKTLKFENLSTVTWIEQMK